MRILPFVMIRRKLRHLTGCLAVFTAMALLSASMFRPTAASASLVDAVQVSQSTFPGTGVGTIRDESASDTGSVTAAKLTVNPTGPSVPQKPILDFDGDGKTDYAVVRDLGGIHYWYVHRSTLGFVGLAFGDIYDYLVPGDYDGDMKWDIAVWREGVFYILMSKTGTLQVVPFGTSGDEPRMTQDFDGDGKADPTVTRNNVDGTLTWYILRSKLGFTAVSFGNRTTDRLMRGDFDGDGKADVAVYRRNDGNPDNNTFYVLRSSDSEIQVRTFGVYATDYIVPADFDGDGKTDYAVWRGAGNGISGTWYWLRSSDGGFRALNFGAGNVDLPVPGDYDGDGICDQAVWRYETPAIFYVNGSASGPFAFPFSQAGDVTLGSQVQPR